MLQTSLCCKQVCAASKSLLQARPHVFPSPLPPSLTPRSSWPNVGKATLAVVEEPALGARFFQRALVAELAPVRFVRRALVLRDALQHRRLLLLSVVIPTDESASHLIPIFPSNSLSPSPSHWRADKRVPSTRARGARKGIADNTGNRTQDAHRQQEHTMHTANRNTRSGNILTDIRKSFDRLTPPGASGPNEPPTPHPSPPAPCPSTKAGGFPAYPSRPTVRER